MHESSMAMSILQIVTEEARKACSGNVVEVRLCVGELAGVEEVTLTACFQMLAEGTMAHQARLAIKRIPATGVCLACGAQVRRQGRTMRCPSCETASIRLATGRELYVEGIEVEQTHGGIDHVQRH